MYNSKTDIVKHITSIVEDIVLIIELQFDMNSNLMECPEAIISELETYQEHFWKWLSDENNDHKYWQIENGAKEAVCYRGEAFAEWLNQFILCNHDLKAKVIKQYVPMDNGYQIVLHF